MTTAATRPRPAAEHYVVDVLAGWAVAALAILVATAARPDGYRRRNRPLRAHVEERS